MIGLHTCSES